MKSQANFNFSYCTDPIFKVKVSKAEELCDICLIQNWNPVRYGEFIVKDCKVAGFEKLRCHFFCLLSATCIPQRGKDSSGIAGFLIRDIIDSFHEFRDKQCAYCSHRSAPIRCTHENCNRWYHYICGYKNSCATEFVGAHNSYCHEHLPEELRKKHPPNRDCEICFEAIPQAADAGYNPAAILQSCRLDDCPPGLLHRECLQQFAFSAGYNFKCPICFSKKYKTYAERCGIFVPCRESSWEREAGAFKNLYKRKCTATNCILNSTGDGGNSCEIVGCKVCGGQLMHKVCTKLQDPAEYSCQACRDASFTKLL